MPWTRRQVKYLLASGSPLSSQQKEKMKGELHADPAMGHMKKGQHREKMKQDMKQYHGEASEYSSDRPKRKILRRHV